MNPTLTPGQRAQLQELLELRQHELDRRVAARLGPSWAEGGRSGRAREVLAQDADDASQRDADREIDLAQADRELLELGAVSRALARVHEPGYGLCADCSAPIPFDRLKVEPWALRCVVCEGAREGPVTSARL